MTRAWPVVPGVPAAGHVTAFGSWHPGPMTTCSRCHPHTTPRKGAK